jgi:hypothetical protein
MILFGVFLCRINHYKCNILGKEKKIKLQPKKARIKQNKEYIQKHFETERKSHQIAILKKKNLGG